MASLVRFRRRTPPVLCHVHFRTLSNTSHTLADQQPTRHQKPRTQQDKRRGRSISPNAVQSWRQGDNTFYNIINLSKAADGLYGHQDVQAAWRSLISSNRGGLAARVPVTQTPTLVEYSMIEAVGDEQDVFLDSSNAFEEVSAEDVVRSLTGWNQYEIEVSNEMERSGKKIKWSAVRSYRPGRSGPAERRERSERSDSAEGPQELQSAAGSPAERRQRLDRSGPAGRRQEVQTYARRPDFQPTSREIRKRPEVDEEDEDEEFDDEFEEEEEEEDEAFDIDEHDSVYDVYEGDAKSEEQWNQFVQSLSLPGDVKKFITDTSDINDDDFEKEVEKMLNDLNRKTSNGETTEITEMEEEFIDETDELLDDVDIERYNREAMERDAEDMIRAFGINSSSPSPGDANVADLEQTNDNELSEEGEPEEVTDPLLIDTTPNLKPHEHFSTIVPQKASEDQKMEIFTQTIEQAPDMLDRDQAREYLPKDFPSPIRVPFEDIVKSGNYVERPVIDDRDLKPTEIYGDYSRWMELQNKRYGPVLTKNGSISPADKAKMSAIIDRFMSQ
ncbi:hypothetical protein V1525DRAFT_412674 [Lipomyces kononenkoae]|uniref:Uncharacterized protein n=1 Tax=Lipomyces kononenkoae TaxID=34357 RepID=A0ACC3SSG5_LIPKO